MTWHLLRVIQNRSRPPGSRLLPLAETSHSTVRHVLSPYSKSSKLTFPQWAKWSFCAVPLWLVYICFASCNIYSDSLLLSESSSSSSSSSLDRQQSWGISTGSQRDLCYEAMQCLASSLQTVFPNTNTLR